MSYYFVAPYGLCIIYISQLTDILKLVPGIG